MLKKKKKIGCVLKIDLEFISLGVELLFLKIIIFLLFKYNKLE